MKPDKCICLECGKIEYIYAVNPIIRDTCQECENKRRKEVRND